MIKLKIKEETIKETCLLAGFLMLETGIWLIYPPAAFIVGGILLLWLGMPGKGGG